MNFYLAIIFLAAQGSFFISANRDMLSSLRRNTEATPIEATHVERSKSKASSHTKKKGEKTKQRKSQSKKKQGQTGSLPSTIYVGLGQAGADAILPTTVDMASANGWEADTDDFASGGGGGMWKSRDLPRFSLSFEDDEQLSDILVDGPPATSAGFDESFYRGHESSLETGIRIRLKDDRGRFAIIANGEKYPKNAKKAERKQWQEGGCVGKMGGSHYYKFMSGKENDWFSNSPIVPIYNKYGTKNGDIHSVLMIFGNVFPSNGFDFKGTPISPTFGCDLNYCSNQACLNYANKFSSGASSVHIMFHDPANVVEWAQCQAPYGECEVQGCSCCGTVENPSGPRTCAYPFA